jgi:hypothetical protein
VRKWWITAERNNGPNLTELTMPDRLTNPNGTLLVDFTGGKKLSSREASCVYLKNFDAYKLFTRKDQAQAAYSNAQMAKNADLPIVRDMKPAYQARLVREDGTENEVWVLQSERHIGEFFQLSKPGQVKTLAQTIRASRPGVRAGAIRAFQAARDHRITDPQGFLDPTLGMPIRFFDIHTGTTPAPQIEEILDLLK